jgi:hypothetical protein
MSMNNSDQPLSSFDEKLMAYVDGKLSEGEATAFEREHPDAIRERASVLKLSSMLKLGSVAPTLRNAEFLNRQILKEITPRASVAVAEEEGRPGFFNLWRLVLAGTFCLLLAAGVYRAFVMPTAPANRPYLAQVLSVKTGDATLTTRLVSEEGLTFVMIDGLEPMSEEFILN